MSPSNRLINGARLAVAAIAIVTVAACDRPQAPSLTPLAVTPAEFQQMRWLEGSWRGSGGGVDGFFEGYRWADDSTIWKYDFADSTFAVISDSGTIALRGGAVRNESPRSSYVVTALDTSRVVFAPERNAANGFEWRRTGPGAWTARLTWDSAGVARERVYDMRAFLRPPLAR